MKITKDEKTIYNNTYKYAFTFEFSLDVLEFCRWLKLQVGWGVFGFGEGAWRFSDLNILNIIKSKYPGIEIDDNVLDDFQELKIEKEKEILELKKLEKLKKKTDSDIEIKGLKMELFPYQKVGVEFFDNNDGKAILADTMGLGKQQCVDSLIMTPSGPKRIGDANIGDDILTQDGSVTKITGVFPQGIKDTYEIIMQDGGKTTAGPEHLWEVYTHHRIVKNKKSKVITTQEILDSGVKQKDGHNKFAIPFQGMMQFTKKELPIDPYVLGALIGDGCLLRGVVLSCPDFDIDIAQRITKIVEKDGYQVKKDTCSACPRYRISKGMHGSNTTKILSDIRELGLNVKSRQKFIPKKYLYSNIEDRKRMLYGLMDTDGSIRKNRTTFSTTSKQLAQDIATLVRSLSGEAMVHSYDRTKDDKGIEYSVNVRVQFNPFLCKRKKEKWSLMKNFSFKYRYIKDIKYIGKKECVCIAVEHPSHLYITDDFIATHNTAQSIAYLVYKKIPKTVVVCPSSVKGAWFNEVKKWSSLKPLIIDSKSKLDTQTYMDHDVFIINYDIIKKHLDFFSYRLDCMILDEFHYIKNSQAQRTKLIMKVAKRIPSKLLLSGTPLLSRPSELFNGLNMLDPKNWDNWYRFTKEFCGGHQGQFGYDYRGATNLDRLQSKIGKYFLRRKKEDVLPDLPEKRFIDIPVELDAENRFNYNLIKDSFLEYLKEVKNKTDKEIKKTMQAEKLVRLGMLRKAVTDGKVKAAEEIIDNIIEGGEKLIVFSCYNEPLDKLEEKFKGISVKITGETPEAMRQSMIDAFQKNPRIKIFFGGIKSAGVGITLTEASSVLFLDYSWVPADHAQAIDRAHRIGSTAEAVSIYQMVCNDTMDEKMKELLDSKQEIFNKLIDNPLEAKKASTSVVNDLIKHFEKTS